MELLDIFGLKTYFFTQRGVVKAVDDVSLSVKPRRVLGLVGESGCGKTITGLSILRLVPPPGRIISGRIMFDGVDILSLSDEELRRIRGSRIAMIFQEPMTALNPVLTVGSQIAEVLTAHLSISMKDALDRTADVLASVGIPAPHKRLKDYPHQFSGGMRQRVMIAMAIALKPSLIIADEPTTALDVTIQAHILELLGRIQDEMGMGMILITHDLGLIAERTHDVAVMYAGKIVELAETLELFQNPVHPYTQGLMASVPRPGRPRKERLSTIPGAVPQLYDLPHGCAFRPRCDIGTKRCEEMPELIEVSAGHLVRCWEAKA